MSSTSSIPASGKITGVQVRIVAVVVLGAFLALLNQTVMSPALPVIMADFGIDASTAQWIMSIYPLVSGIMVPVSAYLIDKFSTRKLFFGALVAFAAGTLLCAVAPDFLWLIVGRVLQAAGSGVLMPLVAVVPMLVFPVEKRGTAMGMAGIVMSAGPAVGPVAGGAVIDAFGWRAMVGSIVPLSLIVLVMGVFMLKNVGEPKNPKLDFASVALSTVAFGGLLYGFSTASSLGWTSPVVLGSVAAGVVCLVLFARRQGKLEQPLLDLGCLRTREFRVAAIIVTLINAACLVTNTLLPLLLQTALGASAFETGMAMLPAAAVGIIISPISGVVFDKFGPDDGRAVRPVAVVYRYAHFGGGSVLHAAGGGSGAGEHAREHVGRQRPAQRDDRTRQRHREHGSSGCRRLVHGAYRHGYDVGDRWWHCGRRHAPGGNCCRRGRGLQGVRRHRPGVAGVLHRCRAPREAKSRLFAGCCEQRRQRLFGCFICGDFAYWFRWRCFGFCLRARCFACRCRHVVCLVARYFARWS